MQLVGDPGAPGKADGGCDGQEYPAVAVHAWAGWVGFVSEAVAAGGDRGHGVAFVMEPFTAAS